MSKENKIREFIEDIEAIASSQVTDSKVIGLDFIAIGNDDDYFQDYLIHSKPIDDYLKALEVFFKDNPSLLVTNLQYEIAKLSNTDKRIIPSDIKLTFQEKKVPKDSFILNYTSGKEVEYWKRWCEIISIFYPNCNSVLFIKLSFGSLDQTTALFIYFDKDVSILDNRRKGWLAKASNAFLYEEAVGVFLPKHVEKIKQDEEIERLRNVSASTHVIKTTINGLFAPPLNSLLQEDQVDPRIEELQTAKEKFIKYAEVINLMSKLSSTYEDEIEIKKSLTGSGLFTKNKKEAGNIGSVLNEIIALRERNPSLTKLTFLSGKGNLSENVFVYANEYYPAKSFYELLLLTIIENVVKHGAADDGKLTVTMNLSAMEITFANCPKPNSKNEIRVEDMTGNFRVFYTILNRLKLGEFNVSNYNNEFKVTLKALENG